ncbi:MAG TPA: glycoside hydrolase family 18 protein [Alloacidobacterium sp.]|nr:glycoside hydrolase family 18 protein [Alloacidobacterium sp.]
MRQQGTSLNTALRYKPALLLACLMSLFLPAGSFAAASHEVIAYVFPQHQRLQPGDVAARKLTRINYAFANLQNGRIVNGFPEDEQNIPTLVALKQQNPSLKVLVSVGGWLWSGNFSDMALTKQSRRQFIDSVVAFIGKYQLDGLDIDWEYPGLIGAGNRFRPEDKHNYTLLLKELRDRFDREEKTGHRKLLLSIAAGASSEFLDHTEMGEVQKYVDTVNLMAYDYYEPDSDKITGHHAPLYTNPADPKKISVDQSVRDFEKAGVPAARIILGVPFYGHVWGDVPAASNGLYQPGKPVPNAFASYSSITAGMLGHGFNRYWDAASSVPYLYSPAQKTFVSYEDTESLRLKCTYVIEHNLGGIMFWDYADDPSGTLLDTIDAGLLQPTPSTQGGPQ